MSAQKKKYAEIVVHKSLSASENPKPDHFRTKGGWIIPNGEVDIIELPDMSYYRRRSPSEKPENLQAGTIIFSPKTGGIMMGWADKYDECDEITFCSGDEGFSPSDIDWWAYAYIPEEGIKV